MSSPHVFQIVRGDGRCSPVAAPAPPGSTTGAPPRPVVDPGDPLTRLVVEAMR